MFKAKLTTLDTDDHLQNTSSVKTKCPKWQSFDSLPHEFHWEFELLETSTACHAPPVGCTKSWTQRKAMKSQLNSFESSTDLQKFDFKLPEAGWRIEMIQAILDSYIEEKVELKIFRSKFQIRLWWDAPSTCRSLANWPLKFIEYVPLQERFMTIFSNIVYIHWFIPANKLTSILSSLNPSGHKRSRIWCVRWLSRPRTFAWCPHPSHGSLLQLRSWRNQTEKKMFRGNLLWKQGSMRLDVTKCYTCSTMKRLVSMATSVYQVGTQHWALLNMKGFPREYEESKGTLSFDFANVPE